jgi:hypothetical protein
MKNIDSINDLYAEVDKLIAKLKSSRNARLADALQYRLHKVAWTSGSELLDELATLLEEAARDGDRNLESELQQDIKVILGAIANRRLIGKHSAHQTHRSLDSVVLKNEVSQKSPTK